MLPIADRHVDYARAWRAERLRAAGLRVEVDERSESIGKKIREAELRKVPYMLVVGDAELEAGTVAVRRHREGDWATPVDEFARRAGRRSPSALARTDAILARMKGNHTTRRRR